MEHWTTQEIMYLVTFVIGVSTFFIGRITAKHGEGKEAGVLMSDMGYVKAGVDDIKKKQEAQEKKEEARHLEVIQRLSSVETSTKQAHRRIDRLEAGTRTTS